MEKKVFKEVFISYRQKDSTEFVEELYNQLKKKLRDWYNITYDALIPYGDSIQKDIEAKIKLCSHFIILLQDDTLDFSLANNIYERQWIIKELTWVIDEIIDGGQQRIIPIITKGKGMPPCMEPSNDITPEDILSAAKKAHDMNFTKEDAIELSDKVKNIKQKYNTYIKTIKAPIIEEIDENAGVDKILHEIFPKVIEALGAKDLIEYKKKLRNKDILAVLLAVLLAVISVVLLAGLGIINNNASKTIKEVKESHSITIDSIKNKAFKSVKLVFAGGGSVANMIKDITPDSLDIKNYDNSLYLSLPSEHAWPLMAEEVMNNHSDTSKNTNRFYPICLSALEANESDFTKIVDRTTFLKKGTVISYHIGDDPLIVYTNLFEFDSKDTVSNKVDTVSNKDLSSAIMNRITWDKDEHKYEITDTFRLYITQEGSGTYYCYRQLIKDNIKIDIDTCKNLLTWYDDSLTSNQLPSPNESTKYVILTSKYYTPKDIASCRRKDKKIIVDKDKQPIKKQLFIYFVAHRNDNDSKTITIPEEMVDFMNNSIGKKDTTKIIRKKIHQNYSEIITPFEDLIEWIKNDSLINNVINHQ